MAKKILVLLLALVMVLAMGTTAFAGNSSETDETGSITIPNAEDGATYTAYKILDVTYADGEGNAFSYTIASDSQWLDVVDDFFDLAPAASDATVLVATAKTGYSAAAFAAALYEALDDMGEDAPAGTVLAGAGTEDLELGYWFVATTTGAICNLTTTHPDSTIRDKNIIEFDKEENSDLTIIGSAQIGDVVPYKITGEVPTTTGYTKYIYTISDTISGADLNKDVKVMIGTTEYTPKAGELVYTGTTGFELTIDVASKAVQALVGQPIVVTYSATVNNSSLTMGEVENTAYLTHSHDPQDGDDTKKEPEVVVLTKVFTLDLSKVADDGATPLAGAQFVLQNEAGQYYQAIARNVQGKKGDYTVIEDVYWVDKLEQALVVTTDEAGKGDAEFAGLRDGKYVLTEIKSPAGYNLPKDKFTVVITKGEKQVVNEEDTDEDGQIDLITKEYTYTATIQTGTKDPVSVSIDDISMVATVIVNHKGALLPETGGFGTTMLIAFGAVMFIAAAIVLVTKKRMYNEG